MVMKILIPIFIIKLRHAKSLPGTVEDFMLVKGQSIFNVTSTIKYSLSWHRNISEWNKSSSACAQDISANMHSRQLLCNALEKHT